MEDLATLYRKWLQWRAKHPDSYYIVFDTSLTYWERPLNRYIVVSAIEMYKFFGDVVVFTMSGYEQLHNAICCKSQREASQLCKRLNAKYVHDNEPELYATSPSWQEIYNNL